VTVGLRGIVALLALAALAAARADAEPVTPHTLPNGLRLLVRGDPASEVVAVSLQVRAGSLFESADRAGLTHFLQRAMLRGTARHSANSLAEAVEELGGTLDAAGDVETAEIRAQVVARHWEALLALLAEVVLAPSLPAEEVEHERRLILSQIHSRGDNPFLATLDALLGTLCGEHPCGRPSLGTPASIGAVTRAVLVAHHREIYQADRLVLVVSGRVQPARVARLVERLFGKMPRGSSPRPELPAPPRPAGQRRLLQRPVHEARILVGFPGPGLEEPDFAAARVLAAVLGGGMSGRLFVALRERRGLAYSVGMLSPFRTAPAFLIAHMGTDPASVEEAEAALRAEIDRLRDEPPGEQEVARGKAHVLGSLAMDRRTNARHAWYLGFFEAVGVGWQFAERYAAAVQAVTAADVLRVAQRYLDRPTVVLLRRPG
jgi:predicted Zn-dependent peptidase